MAGAAAGQDLQERQVYLTPYFIWLRTGHIRTVASPVIETIDQKTFQYKFVTADLMGIFNWKLEFDWTQISRDQQEAMEHKWAPYK